MFSMENEFAYIITDTHQNDANMAPYFALAEEGYNLAFIFNTSVAAEGVDCARGLTCAASDIGNILLGGFDKTLRAEMPLFEEVFMINLKLK